MESNVLQVTILSVETVTGCPESYSNPGAGVVEFGTSSAQLTCRPDAEITYMESSRVLTCLGRGWENVTCLPGILIKA